MRVTVLAVHADRAGQVSLSLDLTGTVDEHAKLALLENLAVIESVTVEPYAKLLIECDEATQACIREIQSLIEKATKA